MYLITCSTNDNNFKWIVGYGETWNEVHAVIYDFHKYYATKTCYTFDKFEDTYNTCLYQINENSYDLLSELQDTYQTTIDDTISDIGFENYTGQTMMLKYINHGVDWIDKDDVAIINKIIENSTLLE